MRRTNVICILLLTLAVEVRAQDVRARLETRGLPAGLVDQVSAIAAEATSQGLPTAPLADKAIEGFAKQVPAERIVAVVRQYGARMIEARGAVQSAGVAQPEGRLIAAATDAMGRGFAAGEIGRVVRAAVNPQIATPGLTVAAALAAQGMPTTIAADVVAQAIQGGSTPAQILDLPSVARSMQSDGMSPENAGRAMLRGERPHGPGAPDAPGRNQGPGRPGGIEGRPGSGGPGPSRPPGDGSAPPPPRPGGNRGPGGPGPRP